MGDFRRHAKEAAHCRSVVRVASRISECNASYGATSLCLHAVICFAESVEWRELAEHPDKDPMSIAYPRKYFCL